MKIIIYDPSMISTEDLKLISAKEPSVYLVRARRPAWGQGNLHRFILQVDSEMFESDDITCILEKLKAE